jgi:hypothetical protein
VKINMPNFSLICRAYSNPGVTWAKISCKLNSDANETSEDGCKKEDYLANVTMVCNQHTLVDLLVVAANSRLELIYVYFSHVFVLDNHFK